MDRRRVMLDAINAANECQQKAFPRPDPVDAALAALEAAGVVMVPREPTYEMASEGDSMMPQFSAEYAGLTGHDVAVEVYTAMLAARPK